MPLSLESISEPQIREWILCKRFLEWHMIRARKPEHDYERGAMCFLVHPSSRVLGSLQM